jgi:hypothetical protein
MSTKLKKTNSQITACVLHGLSFLSCVFFFVCASLYLISFLSVCVFFSWQLNKTKQKCVCANQDRRGELRHIQQIGFFKNFELFSAPFDVCVLSMRGVGCYTQHVGLSLHFLNKNYYHTAL